MLYKKPETDEIKAGLDEILVKLTRRAENLLRLLRRTSWVATILLPHGGVVRIDALNEDDCRRQMADILHRFPGSVPTDGPRPYRDADVQPIERGHQPAVTKKIPCTARQWMAYALAGAMG